MHGCFCVEAAQSLRCVEAEHHDEEYQVRYGGTLADDLRDAKRREIYSHQLTAADYPKAGQA
jgi:hypothetical protein